MNVKGNVPMAVLSQQLADAIAGRRVRAAVFTSFTLPKLMPKKPFGNMQSLSNNKAGGTGNLMFFMKKCQTRENNKSTLRGAFFFFLHSLFFDLL